MPNDYFDENNIEKIDYKDTELLEKFLTTHGRIYSRNHTHVSAKHQREVETAIKRARYMGLLPYVRD